MKARLESMEIRKFRNVAPGTRLEFNDGINVLLGLNATGKTTLLDLLAMAVCGEFGPLQKEEFDISYRVHHGSARADVSISNARVAGRDVAGLLGGVTTEVSWKVALTWTGPQGEPKEWHLESQPADRPFKVGWLAMCLTHSGLWPEPADTLPLQLRFDESLEFFTRMSGRDVELAPRLEVEKERPWSWLLLPEDARAALKGHAAAVTADDIRLARTDVPAFLRKLMPLLGLVDASMSMVWWDADHGRPRYKGLKFVLDDGFRQFPESHLSYGQKRLLAFFYYSACSDVIIADELVNGMHHSWIRACLDEIGDRQAFLTSQNSLLLDHVPVRSPQEAQKTFIICKRDGETLRWQNVDADTARDVFEAREVGIQQLSEILIARDLW
ncbi:MAG: AAA family ATPase [Deltaproteobacteria bacterium]|nr:AAA family ATPase [Deltaproteobacteria bacterium]